MCDSIINNCKQSQNHNVSAAKWKHYDTVVTVKCMECASRHTSSDPDLIRYLINCPICDCHLDGSLVVVKRRRINKIINSWVYRTPWVNVPDDKNDDASRSTTELKGLARNLSSCVDASNNTCHQYDDVWFSGSESDVISSLRASMSKT